MLRLLAGLVLLYTARFPLKGRVTMEEIVFSLKHHWRFLTSESVELHTLSWDLSLEAHERYEEQYSGQVRIVCV